MGDVQQRIAALSPEQRRLLERRLRELRAGRAEVQALTPGQQRLWREQAQVTAPLHVVCQVIDIEGPLDETRLAASLQALVARHDALRTTFALQEGTPRQTVRREMAVPLERIVLSPEEQAAPEAALDRRALGLCAAPFDLGEGPLVRWRLVAIGPERWALLFAAHNLVFDAWSYEIFLSDLTALYGAPGAPALRPAPSFADHVARQRRWLDGDEARRQVDHWREVLRAPLPPPIARAAAEVSEATRSVLGRRAPLTLAAAVKRGLAALARAEGATIFIAQVALLWAALRDRTGRDDLTCGMLSASRAHPDAARTVGYFLNPLPLRADLSGDPTFREVLRRARAAVKGALAHGDVPCEVLAERLRPGVEPGPEAFFDVLLVFENLAVTIDVAGGLRLRLRDVDRGVARSGLTLTLYDSDDTLNGWLEYDAARWEGGDVRRLAERLGHIAEAAVGDPERRLSTLGA